MTITMISMRMAMIITMISMRMAMIITMRAHQVDPEPIMIPVRLSITYQVIEYR